MIKLTPDQIKDINKITSVNNEYGVCGFVSVYALDYLLNNNTESYKTELLIIKEIARFVNTTSIDNVNSILNFTETFHSNKTEKEKRGELVADLLIGSPKGISLPPLVLENLITKKNLRVNQTEDNTDYNCAVIGYASKKRMGKGYEDLAHWVVLINDNIYTWGAKYTKENWAKKCTEEKYSMISNYVYSISKK